MDEPGGNSSQLWTDRDDAVARLAAIVTSSDDAIISKDLAGIIQSWNASAERLFGYTADEAIGRSIRIIVPPDRQTEEDDILSCIRRGERVDHLDTMRVRKDGSLVPISVTISPVRDPTGRIIGASKIARDITERRRAEEAIQRSMAIKDEFLNLVSHELRTPTATILGNLQILVRRGDTLDPDLRNQALADSAAEANRLVGIIENLLALTRIDRETDLRCEPVKLDAVVRSIVHTLGRRHSGWPMKVHAGPIPPVLAEPGLLEMVVENLVSNAVKYSPPGSPVDVLITTEDSWARVTVSDRGIGIPEDEQESIFQKFYRSPSATFSAPGMGLGLAVCRKAIEAQGGRIWASPRTGGGSEFSFTLPLTDVPAGK